VTIEAVYRVLRSVETEGVLVSRATWLDPSRIEKPTQRVAVVGGRTVWDSRRSDWLAVVEQPNFFGRFERRPQQECVSIVRTRRGDAAGIVVDISDPASAVATASAIDLAGRLRQLRGVRLPHGKPESPWLVISLPFDPETAAGALAGAGFASCSTLGAEYPEFPGGIRVEVAWREAENLRFIETLEAVR
jgi:hypothetical protein